MSVLSRFRPLTLAALAAAGCAATPEVPLSYPPTPRGDVVDEYHGRGVPDPYRWLEDTESAETGAWIEAQNAVTNAYLDAIPARAQIKARLKELWDYEKFSVPHKRGGRTFFRRNDGLQNQSVLHVIDTPGAEPRELLDPNTLSDDGTAALKDAAPSPDGKLLAYSVSRSGSDWEEWRVRDIETGRDLGETLVWSKFSGAAWTKDSKGFFYGRYAAPPEGEEYLEANEKQWVAYHVAGTPQSADVTIYERPEHPKWGFGSTVSDDGRFHVITVWKGSGNRNQLFYRDLHARRPAVVVEFLTGWETQWDFVTNQGETFFLQTVKDAPLGRVVAVDLAKPGERREIIPEQAETLRWVSRVGEHLVAGYLKDAHALVRVFDLDGKHVRDVELPGIGSVGGFGGETGDPETFFSFSSYTTPPTVYRYDVATGQSSVFRRSEVDVASDDYVVEQVFYESKDGTRIPMFLTYRKGLERSADTPCYLYGYGGFNIPLTPGFSPSVFTWLERGGIFAVANLRGGGEYGEAWHEAGTKHQKQNVFDDFISGAEWLIAEGYTSTPKLAIAGGSNGGLLVGACMTQRPDLFGACIPAVGVLDMLRYHKFTIGWAWVRDYGSSDDPAEFETLMKYSPLHNLRAGTCYPPTLVVTGDHDDRVVPGHSFKFAAALQNAQGCANPTLIRIETEAGHGAGKPTDKILDEHADRWAFLVRALDL